MERILSVNECLGRTLKFSLIYPYYLFDINEAGNYSWSFFFSTFFGNISRNSPNYSQLRPWPNYFFANCLYAAAKQINIAKSQGNIFGNGKIAGSEEISAANYVIAIQQICSFSHRIKRKRKRKLQTLKRFCSFRSFFIHRFLVI